MRESRRCPKCRGTEIGRLLRVPDATETQTRRKHIAEKVVQGASFMVGDYRMEVGPIEAYLCTECGYVEEYILEAGQIEWEEVEGFHWHRPEGTREGPYR